MTEISSGFDYLSKLGSESEFKFYLRTSTRIYFEYIKIQFLTFLLTYIITLSYYFEYIITSAIVNVFEYIKIQFLN